MVSPAPNAASWRAMPPPPPPPGPPPSRKAGSSSSSSSSSLLRRKPTTVISVGAPPPPPPPPPPPRKDTIEPRMRSPTKSAEQIMRERRRAAHAMYESNEMVEIAGVSTTSTATGSTNSDTDGKNLSDAAVENGENNNHNQNNSTIGSNSNNPAISRTDSISTKPENENNNKRSKQRVSSKASSSSSSAAAASSSATSTATSPRRKTSSSKKPTTPTRRGKKNSAAASPDKQPKRGFFKKILGRNRSSPRNKQQQQPAPKSPSRRGSRRGGGAGNNASKKNPNRSASPKLGRPQDAKPGDSYMSTPHSAEIIVRRDVAAAAKTEEEEQQAVVVEQQQHKVETEDVTTTKNLMGTPTRPQVRTREEGKSPHHNMQIMESFSSPKFEDITVNHTFQTDDGGDPHDDDGDKDNLEEDDDDMGDDVSAVTDPTFQNNQERRPERRSPMNPLLEEDPFSSFWNGGGGRQQQVDPFEDPFFKAQAGFEKQASYQPHQGVYDSDTGERYMGRSTTLQHANDHHHHHHIIATSAESVDVSGLSMGSPGKSRRPQVSPVADPPLTYFHDDDEEEEDDFELESGMGEEQDEEEVHQEADLETAAQVEHDEDDAPDPPLELLDDSGLMDDSLQTDDGETLEDEGARDPPEKENKSPEAGGKNSNNNNNNKDDPPVDPLEEEMMQHFFRRGARSEDETARPMYEIRSVPSDPTFMRKGLPHSDELFIRTAPSLEPPPSKRRAPEPKDLRPPTPPEPRRMPHTHTMLPAARAETTKTLRALSPPPPPPATDKSPATHKALKFMRVGRDTVRSNRARSFSNLESNEAPADELASRDAELSSSSSSSFEPRGFLSKFAKQGQSRRGVEPESSAEPKLEPEPIREPSPPQPSWNPVEERLAPTGATSSGYLSKFSKQGRRPRPLEKEPLVLQTKSGLLPIVPRPGLERKPHRKPPAPQQPETITKARATTIPSEPLTIDSARVEIGMICKRIRRAELLEKGLAAPVVLPLPRKPAEPPQEQPHVDISRMDPIQRAGYRLLSKAAVPIQSAMRRYLAEREAVDRMWALIELQSYFRRWRAEAFVQAHIWSATKIQATFRSWKARDLLEEANYCATEIQRIVRGHLAAIGVYDDIYRIMLVQAHVRGIIARQNAVDRMEKILVLQGAARGFLTRFDICCQHGAATAIQARYRSYSAQLQFQFDIVDVIIVQSVVRRWRARNQFGFLLGVVRVQRAFRQWRSRSMRRERDQAAATKIQKSWRGFVSYMNYIFTIGDILMVQCIARKWLARRRVRTMSTEKRVNRGAVVIQRNWRRYNAQMFVLYKLVHIIIVQSVARRYLATRDVREMRLERWAAGTIQTWWRVESLKKAQHLDWAAVKIQAGWRRFWQYSHYIIVNFEVVRIQAVVRGFIARNESRLHLGCAIILQSIVRRYLAINAVRSYKIAQAVVMGAALSLREKHGAQRIQRGWLQWQQRKKEQKAALVIERFFVMVKVEVDREIKRRNKKKQSKRDRRRRQKKEADDKLLERVWLTTVDTKDTSRRSKSTPRSRHRRPDERLKRPHSKRDPSTRQSSPLRINPAPPTDAVNVRYPDDMSEVTSPSVFNRTGGFTNRQLGPRDMADNLSLEEAWIDTEVRQAKERKVMDDEYVQRHGLQNHGTYDLDNARFFGPDGREMAPSTARSSEVVGLNPLSPSSMSVQPDKRSPKENKHHDVQPQGPPHAPQQQQYSVRRPLYDKQVQASPRFQPSSRGSSVRATSPHRPTKPTHDGGHLQARTPGAKEPHNTMGYPSPNNYRAPSPQNSNQYQGLMQSPSQPSPSARPSPQFHIMTSPVAQQVGQPIVQPMGQPEPTTRRLSQFNSGSSAVAPSDVTARMGNLVPNAATPRGMQQFHSMAATPQIPEVNHRTMGHTVTAPVPSPDMNHRNMGHTVTAPVPSPDMNQRNMGHSVTTRVPSPDMNQRTMGHSVTTRVPSPDMNQRTMGLSVTTRVPSPDMNQRTMGQTAMGHTVTTRVPSPDMNQRTMNQFNLADSPSHGINQFHAVPSPVAQPEPVARSVNQFHPEPSPAAPEVTPRVMGQFHAMQPPVVQTEASHRGMNQFHRAPSPIALSEHTPRSLRRAPSPTVHQSPTVRGFHSRPTPVSQSELDQLQVGTSPSGQPESILRGPTQFHSQGQPERARTPNRFQNVSVPGFSSERSVSQFQSQSVSNPAAATDLPTPNQYRSFDSHGSHPSSRSERFVEQKFHSSPSRESYVESLQQSSSALEASPRRREGTPSRSHPQVSLSLTKSDDRQPVREPIVRRQIEQAQKLFDNKSSPQRDQGNTKTTYFGRRPDITFSNTNASAAPGKTPSSRDENPRYMDRQSGGAVYDVPSSSSYQAFDIPARPVSNGRGRPGQDRIGQYR